MSLPYSASFSGSNYLEIANYTGNPAAFSACAWVNLRASQTSRIFFANFLVAGSKGTGFGISDSVANKVKLYLGSNTLTSATALTTGVWTHVVATYDGTTAKIYLNGNTTPDATLTSAVVYGTTPAKNYIGAEPNISQDLNGRLAGLGVWNKALSTTEVTSLYNGGVGLAGADLSGTLLTSLQSYHDFLNSASLGTDSSGNSHTYTNTGTVVQAYGPNPPFVAYSGRTQRPYLPVLQGRWSRGLVRSVVFTDPRKTNWTDLARGTTDPAGAGVNPGSGAILMGSNAYGPCLTPTDSTGDGNVNLGTPIAAGATEFTLVALATTNTTVGGSAGLRHLWGAEATATTDARVVLSLGQLVFQVGNDGAFTNLIIDPPPLNVPVVITCRLTTSGVRSIWYGATKVAERTDSGCAWGSNAANLGLGSSAYYNQRNWSGQVNGGLVYNLAISDADVIARANDFFAPVQPLRSGFAPLLAFAAMISGPRKLAGPGGLAGPYAHLAGNM